jgi:hypothetical protein
MAKIAKQGGIAYIGINDSRQRLYHIGSTILTAQTRDSKLLSIIEKLSRKSAKNSNVNTVLGSLESFLKNYYADSSIGIFGLGRSDELQSVHLELRTRSQRFGYEATGIESLLE